MCVCVEGGGGGAEVELFLKVKRRRQGGKQTLFLIVVFSFFLLSSGVCGCSTAQKGGVGRENRRNHAGNTGPEGAATTRTARLFKND